MRPYSNTCFAPDSPFFQFQQFIYTSGPTMIRTGTNFCIDFGTNLGADGQALKIWQCYPGLAQQQLFITQDRHIAVENRPVSGQCADVRAESGPEPLKPYGLTKRVQSWDCIGGNTNQVSGPHKGGGM
ncbi:hypothetical protein QFC19_006187 [Naganishia cerealis]|uniref:Uncharacterized protein n=1 Tax=Naganishia cerealis TaxID=610337 RepID=A0ACC2VHU8_9TREE|nr:hypothetical protein QFC19_006187 [Naganishia cerealis]